MFKLIAVFALVVAVANAGFIGHTAPAIAVAAPVPHASSYANSNLLAVNPAPVSVAAHAAPIAFAAHAAPAAVAVPVASVGIAHGGLLGHGGLFGHGGLIGGHGGLIHH